MALVTTSHARGRGARKGPAFFALLLLFAGASEADVTVAVRDNMVAVTAENATIRSILEALSNKHVVDVTASIPLQAVVSLATDAEPLPRLLRRLLRPYSYTLIEHEASSGLLPRLHIFADAAPGAPVRWDARAKPATNPIDQALADLASPDEEMRAEAVLALSDTGDPDVVTHFFVTLNDPSPDVREAARAALEDMDTYVPDESD